MKNNIVKKKYIILFAGIFVFGAGMLVGWQLKQNNIFQGENLSNADYLRLGGYQFISPLLVCDTYAEKSSSDFSAIENDINQLIFEKKASGEIDQISVYYRDLSSGNQMTINPTEKYYPASLNKVPFMIAYLKYAESNPEILSKKVKIENNIPLTNDAQEIRPQDEAKVGQSYSVEELIKKMIKYSDNNSFYALANSLDRKYFDSTYSDFGITYPKDQSDQPDFITTYDFSFFLRVLYNATYLKRDLSEKALNIMSDVDYKKGIVAGLPEGTKISHKFGLKNDVDSSGKTVSRELHNCGIIYREDSPYLLCVMTKSKSEISQISEIIKNISELIYQQTVKAH